MATEVMSGHGDGHGHYGNCVQVRMAATGYGHCNDGDGLVGTVAQYWLSD